MGSTFQRDENSLSAVSKLSTTLVWPGKSAGFLSGGMCCGLTKDAQPGLLAEGSQRIPLLRLLKLHGRMMESCDGPALNHTSLTEWGDNCQ